MALFKQNTEDCVPTEGGDTIPYFPRLGNAMGETTNMNLLKHV